ncbi:MAG: carbohydrate-binding family 9-like protein [Gemmatimonadota bacterium]|jgi:hypothetical protein
MSPPSAIAAAFLARFVSSPVAAACLALLAASSVAAQAPVPREYEAPRAPEAPVVDGALDDPVWTVAPWTEDFVDIRGASHAEPPHRTRVRMLWDDRYLYVAAELDEPRLWGTLRERDAIVWKDDDFEVFLDPDGRGLAYYEVEVNALGTVLDLWLPRPYRLGGRARIDWDLRGLFAEVALDGTLNDPSDRDRRWTVELAIPWSGLVPPPDADGPAPRSGRPPKPGEVWRVNFSRVRWPLEVEGGQYGKEAGVPGEHPESNWVWSPQGEVDMHLPARWGRVRFVDGPPGGGGRHEAGDPDSPRTTSEPGGLNPDGGRS